jgi:hypothetical protein
MHNASVGVVVLFDKTITRVSVPTICSAMSTCLMDMSALEIKL